MRSADSDVIQGRMEEWRAQGKLIPVELSGAGAARKGEVGVQYWTSRQRTMRGVKSLALWWGLALLSVAIPGVHFVSVPVFFIIGCIRPFIAAGQKSVVLGGLGACPFCGKPFQIVRAWHRWPLDDVCEECHRHVKIAPA